MADSYSDEVIAFLDIIGFTEMVEATVNSPEAITDIVKVLARARAAMKTFETAITEINTQTFSDTTMILCSQTDPLVLVSFVTMISLYQCSMITSGNVLRGAVAVGPVFRSEGVTFGPAIIEAHRTELLAEWPRVLVAPSVLARLNAWKSEDKIDPYVLLDDSGHTYVDYLMEGCLWLMAHQWATEYTANVKRPHLADMRGLLSCHRETAVSLRNKAKGCAKNLARCHSLARYHNSTVERLKERLAQWRPSDGLIGQGKDLSYVAVNFLGGVAGRSVEVPTSLKEFMERSAPSEEYRESAITRLQGLNQATADFTRSKLREATESKDALNELLIDLPLCFPTFYGRPADS